MSVRKQEIRTLFINLLTIQHDMLERARAHREAHTYVAKNYEEFGEIINSKPGFIKAMWCGDRACEDKIKEDFQATSIQ